MGSPIDAAVWAAVFLSVVNFVAFLISRAASGAKIRELEGANAALLEKAAELQQKHSHLYEWVGKVQSEQLNQGAEIKDIIDDTSTTETLLLIHRKIRELVERNNLR